MERNLDITEQVTEFWVQSMAWTTAELARAEADPAAVPIDRRRLIESALMHGKLFRLWRDHAMETRLMLFRLETR